MPESFPESFVGWALLCAAAFGAGVVNSVAGGGTLLTFPSLLAVMSPVLANGTSTFALFPGSLAAAWGYRTELARCRKHLVRLLPPSFIGGVIGSLLVTRLPERVFADAVPWLLVTASTLLLVQKPLSRWVGAHPHEEPAARTLAAIVFFQFLVGVYGGYFGAGIGILMLSSLAFVGIHDIHEMNAVKTVLAAAMNGVTIVVFALSGAIVWKVAFVMAVAASVGGYTGARVARKMPAPFIRGLVVAIGFGVAAYSFFGKR
ncbi:MAG: sulfite exporter TauE/SafE family protein [Bryobacterales bacterium]|nr:sulfite exporter TauE/SafE family protein [Bryobacterales bacterium]